MPKVPTDPNKPNVNEAINPTPKGRPSTNGGTTLSGSVSAAAVLNEYLNLLIKARAETNMLSVISQIDSICQAAKAAANGKDGCGCCIVRINFTVESPGGYRNGWLTGERWDRPQGRATGITFLGVHYVPKKCKDAKVSPAMNDPAQRNTVQKRSL